MSETEAATAITCHCGRVTITLLEHPKEITECNCSLCRSYGVRWAYLPMAQIAVMPETAATETYAWNGRHVDFHRCRQCGCVTHWVPRDSSRERRGVNANLLPTAVFEAARLRHRDGAGSGEYVD